MGHEEGSTTVKSMTGILLLNFNLHSFFSISRFQHQRVQPKLAGEFGDKDGFRRSSSLRKLFVGIILTFLIHNSA
jgi:hypothetical protein